jgi:hypothetical protein
LIYSNEIKFKNELFIQKDSKTNGKQAEVSSSTSSASKNFKPTDRLNPKTVDLVRKLIIRFFSF